MSHLKEDLKIMADLIKRSVTLTSKRAIGEKEVHVDLLPTEGGPADFVILHGTNTLLSAVLHPSYDRTTIRAGVIVARRKSKRWFLSDIDEVASLDDDTLVGNCHS
jgi:hypothetical protein